MGKRLLLCLLMSLTVLPALSFTSAGATRNKNIPGVALVIPSKHAETAEKKTATGPEDADIYYNLGVTLGREGKYKEAAEAYEKAISIRPDYAEAHYNQGFAYNELGMYKEAEHAFRQAVRIKPGLADTAPPVNEEPKDAAPAAGEAGEPEKDTAAPPVKETPVAQVKESPAPRVKETEDTKAGGDTRMMPPQEHSKYIVQVGAFRNIDYANELVEKLKPYYQYVYIEREGSFNKVRIPGIETRKQGDAVMRALKEKLRLRSFLLRGYRE